MKNSTIKNINEFLKDWDGVSSKGQAAYDQMFEIEKQQALTQDCIEGICSCCPGSMYYGI